MTTTRQLVELIPATPQRLWGVPAVLNFALGGLGSGFYAAAALAARSETSATLALATWLGPALVFAGFAAVVTEAGRPLRGARVLVRVRTSWMSRELVLGVGFAAAALVHRVVPGPISLAVAVLVALALAAAQGFIARRAKAIAAWDVPMLPVVFVTSALVSGAGLVLVVEAARIARPDGGLLAGALVIVIVGFVAWRAYVTWSQEPAFARPTEPLRVGPGVTLVVVGYLVPALVLASTLALPVPGLAALAGILMLAGQVWTKWLLILAVGTLRAVTIGTLHFGRRVT